MKVSFSSELLGFWFIWVYLNIKKKVICNIGYLLLMHMFASYKIYKLTLDGLACRDAALSKQARGRIEWEEERGKSLVCPLSGRPTRRYTLVYAMVYEVFAFGQYSPLYTENDDRPKRLTVANNFLSHQRGNSLSLDLSNESKSRGVAGLLSALLMCINRHNSTNFF